MGRIEKAIYVVLLLVLVGVLYIIFLVPGTKPFGVVRKVTLPDVTVSEEEVVSEENSKEDESVEYYSEEEILEYLDTYANAGGKWKMKEDGYFVFYPDVSFGSALALLYEYPENKNLLEQYNGILDSMKKYTKYVDNAYGKTCRLAIANPLNSNTVMVEFQNEEVVYDAIKEL